jgi:V/A-type H+-transporting ATPase subunit E
MKLEEITQKIYAEGVEKGNAQAKQIEDKAKAEAAAIVENAKKEADAIIAQASAKAAELDKNTRSELRLYAEQSINAVKTAVTDLINGQVTKESVKAATTDPQFMQSLILKMAEQMAKDGNVVIETKDAETLRTYFAAHAKALLDKGVSIEEVKGIKTNFQIRPAQGGYKLAFGEEELVAYFKEFLRPQLIEMLF